MRDLETWGISSRETWPEWDEAWYPAGPRALAKAARSAGWEARIGFSRGHTDGGVRDIIGVWLDGFGRRAAAFWERNPDAEFSARKLEAGVKDGEIPSGAQWSSSGTMVMAGKGMSWGYANLTDFREWLALQGNVPPEWYTNVQSWVQAHAERDARKTKDTPARGGAREHA